MFYHLFFRVRMTTVQNNRRLNGHKFRIMTSWRRQQQVQPRVSQSTHTYTSDSFLPLKIHFPILPSVVRAGSYYWVPPSHDTHLFVFQVVVSGLSFHSCAVPVDMHTPNLERASYLITLKLSWWERAFSYADIINSIPCTQIYTIRN